MADSPQNEANGPVGIIVKTDGNELPDTTMIQSVRVSKELGRIPIATVTILSDSAQIEDFEEIDDDAFKIGAEIEIQGSYGGGAANTVFKGVIAAMRLRIDMRRGQMLELTCRDKALKLTEVRKSELYENKKDSDIISQIVSNAGLTADVTATTAQLTQFRNEASDWDYLRLLADRNGYVISVDAGTVSAKAPDLNKAAALKVILGQDIFELDIDIDSQRMIKKATYRSWDDATQQMVTGVSAALIDNTLGNVSANDIAKIMGDREIERAVGANSESAVLKTFGDARTLRTGLDAVQGSCKFIGSAVIGPGDMLEISGVGDRFSGTGYVGGVVHVIEGGSWTTTARLGLPSDWVTDRSGLGASQSGGVTSPLAGLHIGVVMKIHEDPDSRHRVQIKVPAVLKDDELIWARFASGYASNEFGIFFLPEIADEVVVAFLNEDPNAPVILGALHNGTAPPPYTAEAGNNTKGIVTREKMKIEFDEEKVIITVETPGGHKIVMDDDDASVTVECSNGNSMVLDDSGITLDTPSDMTLTAGGNIEITATGDTKISGMNVEASAGTGFTGKGGATAEVSSGGQTTVKGPMVMIN